MSVVLDTYQQIVRDYFPRSRLLSDWTISMAQHQESEPITLCRLMKTLLIRESEDTEQQMSLQVNLIHACVHVVTRRGHGKGWSIGMERAAERAEELEEPDLAERLRHEVEDFSTQRDYAGPREMARATLNGWLKHRGWSFADEPDSHLCDVGKTLRKVPWKLRMRNVFVRYREDYLDAESKRQGDVAGREAAST